MAHPAPPLPQVLKFELARAPERAGYGAFGMDTVVERLSAFRAARLSRCPAGAGAPRLYFASMDVRRCYDGIDQRLLLEVVAAAVTESVYVVERAVVAAAEDAPRQRAGVCAGAAAASVAGVAARGGGTSGRRCAVAASHAAVTRRDVLALLAEHIQRSEVAVRGRVRRQATGIAQGSVCSSLLCHLYYGHVERKLLAGLSDRIDGDASLLLRLTDDYLLVTEDRALAEAFVATMLAADASGLLGVNPGKTLLNFDGRGRDGAPLARVRWPAGGGADGDGHGDGHGDGDRDGYFPWCGVCVHTARCDAVPSFAKLVAARGSGAAAVGARPGAALVRRAAVLVRPRWHALLVSAAVCSKAAVRRNVFELFLVVAVKLLEHAEGLPFLGTRVLKRAVAAAVRAAAAVTRQQGRKWAVGVPSGREVERLGRAAFRRVLRERG